MANRRMCLACHKKTDCMKLALEHKGDLKKLACPYCGQRESLTVICNKEPK